MQNSHPTQPFSLDKQYVKNVAAARGDAEEGDEVEGSGTVEKEKPCKTPTVSKNPSGWQYGTLRKEFIGKAMANDSKLGYQDAVKMWDSSSEKTTFLAAVGVGELKRRKFVPAGTTTNPWFDQLHGK